MARVTSIIGVVCLSLNYLQPYTFCLVIVAGFVCSSWILKLTIPLLEGVQVNCFANKLTEIQDAWTAVVFSGHWKRNLHDLASHNLNYEEYNIHYLSYTEKMASRIKSKTLILPTRWLKLFLEEENVSACCNMEHWVLAASGATKTETAALCPPSAE